MFRVDPETVIDATMTGGPARYINHSCDVSFASLSIYSYAQWIINSSLEKVLRLGLE